MALYMCLTCILSAFSRYFNFFCAFLFLLMALKKITGNLSIRRTHMSKPTLIKTTLICALSALMLSGCSNQANKAAQPKKAAR